MCDLQPPFVSCLLTFMLPGTWTLVIEYKDREVERFSLKFRNEELLKLWENTLNKVKMAYKSHVPNTHLVSMGIPMTPVSSQGRGDGLYLDDDDDDDDEDEDEEDLHTARSRSNSVSAQQALGMRPKMMRNNSQDASMFMINNKHNSNRPPMPMPSMSLSSIPRSTGGGYPSATSPSPNDYGLYPASPPPSSPSSPGTSTRTSSSASSSWHRRGDDSPLVDIGTKFLNATDVLTPNSEEFRPLGVVPARSHSHSAAADMYNPSSPPPMPTGPSRSHTRVRSQSSPNIHKSHNITHWDDMPQVPINSRTLYNRDPALSNGVRNVSSTPRLSEMASLQQQQQQAQVDRVVAAVPNSPGTVKIKLSYNDGIYVIMVAEQVTFTELMEKVERKIRLVANLKPSDMLRLKYQDEDGDLITINSDDDVQMAFENRGNNSALNLFVNI